MAPPTSPFFTRQGKVTVMYVHRRARAIFLANPRTASRSVALALTGVGFQLEGSHHSYDASQARGYALRFSVERDEEELLDSWARFFRCDPADRQLVLEKLDRQRAIIPGWTEGLFPHRASSTRVLRFERLELELQELLAELGLPFVGLPSIGHTKGPADSTREGRPTDPIAGADRRR